MEFNNLFFMNLFGAKKADATNVSSEPSAKKETRINSLATNSIMDVNKLYSNEKGQNNNVSIFMKNFDRNSDGKFDESEFKDMQLAAKYIKSDDEFKSANFDVNKDDIIDENEMEFFKLQEKADENKDGKISAEEAKNLAIKEADTNKDGRISAEEQNTYMQKLMDVNKDGEISALEEAFFYTKLMDVDGDGIVSDAEKEAYVNSQIDTNGDGNISAEEMGRYADDYAEQITPQRQVSAARGERVGGASNETVNSKPMPTIAEEVATSDKNVKELEDKITQVKKETTESIAKEEESIKQQEKALTEAKESDSQEIKNLKTEISNKNAEIDAKEKEVVEKDSEIDALKSSISADKATLANYEKELSGLKTDTKNPQINAKNQARKTQLQNQIAQLKAKIKANETKLKETQAARESLKNETIPQLKKDLEGLENQLAEKDTSYKQNVENLQKARVDFEKKKAEIQKAGDAKVAELEGQLQTAQAKRLELNEKQGTIKGNAGQMGAAIDSIMAQNGVLAGKGDLIAQIADEFGIPAEHFAAIIAMETGRGTSNAIRNKNNPGGIMDPKTNWMKLKVYGSLEQGLRAMASNLKRNYYSKGLTTLAKIQPKYCPVGAANDPRGLNGGWLKGTTYYANKLLNMVG